MNEENEAKEQDSRAEKYTKAIQEIKAAKEEAIELEKLADEAEKENIEAKEKASTATEENVEAANKLAEETAEKYTSAAEAAEQAKKSLEELKKEVKEVEPENISKLRTLLTTLSQQHKRLEDYGSSADFVKDTESNKLYIYIYICLLLENAPSGKRAIVANTTAYTTRESRVKEDYSNYSVKNWIEVENEAQHLDPDLLSFMKNILMHQCMSQVQNAEIGPGIFGRVKNAMGLSQTLQLQYQHIAQTLLDIIQTGLNALPQGTYGENKLRIFNSETYPKIEKSIWGYSKWTDDEENRLAKDWEEGFNSENQTERLSIAS